jgi:hypothetical protein
MKATPQLPPVSRRPGTAFGWILVTSPVIALVAPLPYPTTSLVNAALEQSDLPIARIDVKSPSSVTLPSMSMPASAASRSCRRDLLRTAERGL